MRGDGRADLLSAVAEPDAHDLLLHAEGVGERGDLLAGGFGVVQEGLLERHAHAGLDGGALLAAAAHRLGQRRARARRRAAARQRRVRVLQPLLQQRLQLAHVFEAKVERLEARDRRLREVVAVQLAHGEPHVALREPCTVRKAHISVHYKIMNL